MIKAITILSLFLTIFNFTTSAQSAEMATIKGKIMFTDAGATGTEIIVAENIESHKTYSTRKGDIKIQSEAMATYTLSVPPGTYYVYSKPSPTWGKASYYTEFVLCGQRVDCRSHKKIRVNAIKGKITTNIDPMDDYFTEETVADPTTPKTLIPPAGVKNNVDTLISAPASNPAIQLSAPTDSATKTPHDKDFMLFTDPEGFFEISIPANWKEEKSKNSILLIRDPQLENRRIDIDKFEFHKNTPSLEAFSKSQLEEFKKGKTRNGDMLNNSGFITFGSKKFWFVDYTSTKNTRFIVYQLFYGNYKYNFYYIAPAGEFEPGLKTIQDILISLKFK